MVKLVKDYIRVVSANVSEAKRRNISLDMARGEALTLEHIERHRNALLGMPEVEHVPPTLDAYILYRVPREVAFVSGSDPGSIGFTKATLQSTLQSMTDIVKEVYRPTANFDL